MQPALFHRVRLVKLPHSDTNTRGFFLVYSPREYQTRQMKQTDALLKGHWQLPEWQVLQWQELRGVGVTVADPVVAGATPARVAPIELGIGFFI